MIITLTAEDGSGWNENYDQIREEFFIWTGRIVVTNANFNNTHEKMKYQPHETSEVNNLNFLTLKKFPERNETFFNGSLCHFVLFFVLNLSSY